MRFDAAKVEAASAPELRDMIRRGEALRADMLASVQYLDWMLQNLHKALNAAEKMEAVW